MSKIEDFKDLKRSVETSISVKRKAGFDTYLPELMSHLIESHIKMAEATDDIEDIERCNTLFDSINEELDNSVRLEEENV